MDADAGCFGYLIVFPNRSLLVGMYRTISDDFNLFDYCFL